MVNGWERVDYLKPTPDFTEPHSFRKSPVEDLVAAEVAGEQSCVGLTEVNGFTRYTLTGADVRGFLDRMTPSRLPTREGRVALTYLLNHGG